MKFDQFSEKKHLAFRFSISAAGIVLLLCIASANSKAAEQISAAEAKAATNDYAKAVLAFKGKQLRTEAISANKGYTKVSVHAEVLEVFKGDAARGKTIVFTTTADSDQGPFDSGPFEPHTEWIFFLKEEPTIRDFELFELENSRIQWSGMATKLLRTLKDAWDAYLKVADQFVEGNEEG